MPLTLMQRIYFFAAAAPLLVAIFFGGGAAAAGATPALACAVQGTVAPADAATVPSSSGSYGYGY